jgi:SAM-dependent methyltransferase
MGRGSTVGASVRSGGFKIFRFWTSLLFDPRVAVSKALALPVFLRNLATYGLRARFTPFPLRLDELMYMTYDRFGSAGAVWGHYFLQDLWAAQWLFRHDVAYHVDVGSRIDGFVGHLLTFSRVCYVDIRPVHAIVPGFEFRPGNIVRLPFQDDSLETLSCLHAIEHVGLGRYGDPVDPQGHVKAARELSRVLKPGGALLLSTPVGRQRVVFDAHRVFDPSAVVEIFSTLRLEAFHLIDDQGLQILHDAPFDGARRCDYGCGMFLFRKGASVEPVPLGEHSGRQKVFRVRDGPPRLLFTQDARLRPARDDTGHPVDH